MKVDSIGKYQKNYFIRYWMRGKAAKGEPSKVFVTEWFDTEKQRDNALFQSLKVGTSDTAKEI